MKELSNRNSTPKNNEYVDKDDSDNSDNSNTDSEKDEDNNEYDKLNEIDKEKINKLILDIKDISGNFDLKEYLNLEKKFIPKNIKNRTDFIAEDLKKLFHKAMSTTIYEFIKKNVFKNLEKYLKKISEEQKLFNLSNNLIEKYECISEPLKVLEESENNFKEELKKFKNIKIIR